MQQLVDEIVDGKSASEMIAALMQGVESVVNAPELGDLHGSVR